MMHLKLLPLLLPMQRCMYGHVPRFILGSETHNVSGDRHSDVPMDTATYQGHLVAGTQGWIEQQASDSEAIVKAENHSITQTILELQITSAAHFKPHHRTARAVINVHGFRSNHNLVEPDLRN